MESIKGFILTVLAICFMLFAVGGTLISLIYIARVLGL